MRTEQFKSKVQIAGFSWCVCVVAAVLVAKFSIQATVAAAAAAR